MTNEEIKAVYNLWLENPYFDDETKKELLSIRNDEKEILDRFYMDLEFGTAGLRGVIGAGTNRMNIYTVRKATQGLANFINKEGKGEMGVAIAYDSRHFSKEFAMEAALTLAANNIKAYLFDDLRPTPELSFATRYLGATAGINITASHNPAKYNGYKAYWADGAQITPPYDTGIMNEVKAISDYASCKTMSEEDAKAAGLLEIIGSKVDDAYIEEIKKQVKNPELIKKHADEIKIVYTPLHGAGNVLVRRALDELGFKNVYVVSEQEKPDGAFPTVSYPNPEVDEAFELALALAKEVDADIVLATDPDSDRLGARVKDADGNYHTLTGNLNGALIGDYELKAMKEKGSLPDDGVLISTVVSSKMGEAVAKSYGVAYKEVLTGFKYIGEQIKLMEETGKGQYLFGYEESYGCLVGTYARDKDAVVAVVALSEMTAYYKDKGMNMWDAVVALYEKYGYYKESVLSFTFEGIEGKQKMDDIMSKLGSEQPKAFGDFEVVAKRDYSKQMRKNMATGEEKPIDLPKAKVIYYEVSGDGWCCVRPSGTEPKIKLYFGVKGSSPEDAKALEEKLASSVRNYIGI